MMMSIRMPRRWHWPPPGGNHPEGSLPAIRHAGEQALEKALERIERTVATYPVQAIAVAVSAGILLGWWVKRR